MTDGEVRKLWRSHRERLRSGKEPIRLVMQPDTGVPGTWAIAATSPSFPFPIGVVYVRWHTLRRLELVSIHVFDELRTAGVGQKLLSELVAVSRSSKIVEIFTWSVSDLAAGICKRAGFRRRRDGWYLQVSR